MKNFCCCFAFSKNNDRKLCYENQEVHIKRAPEPNDIIWENLGHSAMYKFKRRIFTNFMTGVVLLVCFIVIFTISYCQVFLMIFLLNIRFLGFFKRNLQEFIIDYTIFGEIIRLFGFFSHCFYQYLSFVINSAIREVLSMKLIFLPTV